MKIESPSLPIPKARHLYFAEVEVERMFQAGKTKAGSHRIIPITGGRVEGERITGSIRRIGADWNTTWNEGGIRSRVSTRYVLSTEDGAVISIFTEGRGKYGLKALLSIMRRNPDPLALKFRQHLYFMTGDARYSWLNDKVCFAMVCMNREMKVCYDAYELE